MADLNIVTYESSYNARGLRDASKGRIVFGYCHQHYPKYMIVLQETHSAVKDSKFWHAEWGTQILFSHGRSPHDSGVAILLPRSMAGVCNITVQSQDEDGRLLIAVLEYEQVKVTIIAVYVPTQGHCQQQIAFLENIQSRINALDTDESSHILLVGDFNIHLSGLDVSNGRFRMTSAARFLSQILKENDLVDVWRNRYNDRRQYTWRRLNPIQQSRIDYVFANESLISNHVVKRIEIKPGILSDHSFVNIEICLFKSQRGPGLWRFNNYLLEDIEFVAWVRHEIKTARRGEGIYGEVSNMGLKIEMLTSSIRVQSIRLGKQKARHRKQESEVLSKELQECEIELCENPAEEIIDRYNALRIRMDQAEEERGRIAMIRSGARWVEQGEKATRYFLKMNSNRNDKKQISVIQNTNGDLITGDKDILRYCRTFFQDIYASRACNRDSSGNAGGFLDSLHYPRLSETDKSLCDGPITNQECATALNVVMLLTTCC